MLAACQAAEGEAPSAAVAEIMALGSPLGEALQLVHQPIGEGVGALHGNRKDLGGLLRVGSGEVGEEDVEGGGAQTK